MDSKFGASFCILDHAFFAMIAAATRRSAVKGRSSSANGVIIFFTY